MTRRPSRALARRSALALSLLMVVSALALPAVAEDDTTDRSYTASVTPEEVCNGVEEAFTLTLTNTSSQQRLGSARIDVPGEVVLSTDADGADDLAVEVSGQRGPKTDPIVSYDDVTRVISLDDLSAAPGATIDVTFTATATGDDDTSVEFTTQAKQANDFNSTSDTANELVLVGEQPTTMIISCGTLAFVEQPGDTSVDVAIPGVDGLYPPQVAIVDGDGAVIAEASASISIALTYIEDGLDGTLTQDTVGGIATFDDLEVDTAGTYTLTASADGYLDVESEGFEVFAFGTTCEEGVRCTTTLNDDGDGTTTASGLADGDNGSILGSAVANPFEVCGNPMDYDVDDYSYIPSQVTINGINLVDKIIEFRVSKQYDQRQTNNGVAFYQICATPLAPFTDLSTFVDIFGNRVVNADDTENLKRFGLTDHDEGTEFQTSGFLSDCSGPDDTPCVESRVKRNGAPVITVRWGTRWTMG